MLLTALLAFLVSMTTYALDAAGAGLAFARLGEIAVIVFAIAGVVAIAYPKSGAWRLGEHAHA
jgi:hypothetical protein